MFPRVTRMAGLLICAAALLLPAFVVAEDPGKEDRVWLGVLIDDENLDGGIHLVVVIPGGPAAAGGLQRGDILLEADGRGLVRSEDLESVLSLRGPGDRLRLKVLRAGDAYDRQVQLAQRPSDRWTQLPPSFTRPSMPAVPDPPAPVPHTRAASYGFTVADVTPDLRAYYGAPEEIGVLVTEVRPGRAAFRAGLRVGDVLVELDAVEVRHAVDVEDLLPVGNTESDTVEARVVRDNRSTVTRLAVPELRVRPAVPVSLAGDAEEFETLERLIQLEMERLSRRLVELELRLQQLREVREADPER